MPSFVYLDLIGFVQVQKYEEPSISFNAVTC